MNAEERLARREASRRRHARRRSLALAAAGLLAVALVLGALIATGALSSPSSSPRSTGSRASRAASDRRGPGARAGGGASRASLARSAGSDRAAAGRGSSSAAAAVVRGGEAPRDVSVPVLMYHVINPPPPGAKFPGLYVSRGELEGQVGALARAGFHAVTMDQVLAHWRTGAAMPSKPIVLSFDNGYQSQFSNALPVLRSAGWVGVENIQLTGLPPSQGGMSESQVRGLVTAGWELDTQGISHADLIALSPSALHEQVAVAREVLKRRYGVPVNWFCYPSGHYNSAVIAQVKAAGYVGSTTVVPGWASPGEDPYRLPRLRVLNGTSPSALLAQIAAAQSAAAPGPSYP
jgi:peptidoglycan/xylan/chitin deacetylase (PgdA/CDA1 family)